MLIISNLKALQSLLQNMLVTKTRISSSDISIEVYDTTKSTEEFPPVFEDVVSNRIPFIDETPRNPKNSGSSSTVSILITDTTNVTQTNYSAMASYEESTHKVYTSCNTLDDGQISANDAHVTRYC